MCTAGGQSHFFFMSKFIMRYRNYTDQDAHKSNYKPGHLKVGESVKRTCDWVSVVQEVNTKRRRGEIHRDTTRPCL